MSFDDLPHSLNENGSLPEERFKDPNEVRSFANQLIRADDPRATARAQVTGIIDGNRPYPQGVLAAQQQGWRANVNYREGEGQVSSQRTPYYDLATESSPCVSIELDYGTGQQRADWEAILAENLHWLFYSDTNGFNMHWHLQLQQSEMVVHGWGSHLHLGKVDWRPTTRTMRHVLFPDRTTSCLDDSLETFVVREPLKAHQLYRMIRNEKSAAAVGWKPKAVKDAIVDSRRTTTPWKKTAEDYQKLLKNNDLGFSLNASDEIWLNHVFVREFEGGKNGKGGISHYIIAEGGAGNEYLYVKRNRFQEWSNIITLFPYDIGSDGTIHSIRGLGVRIFPFIELSNRLKNHMVDSVLIGSGVLLMNKGADPAKLALTSIGPMKVLPAGVEPATYKAMDLSQGPLALSQDLKATSDENNKVFRQGPSQRQYAATAREIDQVSSDSAQLQKSAHNIYYGCLDRQYAEMTRRACNPNYDTCMPGGERAVEFQRRCLRAGVPKAALAKICSVKAVRSVGAGSASQRIQIARELLTTIFPGADEVGRYNIKRDYVTALTNSSHADRYVPRIDVSAAPTDDDSVAVLENNALVVGGEALVTSPQNHYKHALRHIKKSADMTRALEQGTDPRAVMAAMDALGPHIGAHLAYLEQDPTRKPQFQALEQQFMLLSKFADRLRQHLTEQAKAAQEEAANAPQQQPTGPFPTDELNLEYMKMRGQLEIKAQKTKADLVLKAEKQAGTARLQDASTAADIRRKGVAQVGSTK